MSQEQAEQLLSTILNQSFPGDYYLFVDYGYGDGYCTGPYTAFDALKTWHETYTHESGEWPPAGMMDLYKRFNKARNELGIGISDHEIVFDADPFEL